MWTLVLEHSSENLSHRDLLRILKNVFSGPRAGRREDSVDVKKNDTRE